jgi:hypothetical protein
VELKLVADDGLEVVGHEPPFDEVCLGEGLPDPGGRLRQIEVDDDGACFGMSVGEVGRGHGVRSLLQSWVQSGRSVRWFDAKVGGVRFRVLVSIGKSGQFGCAW